MQSNLSTSTSPQRQAMQPYQAMQPQQPMVINITVENNNTNVNESESKTSEKSEPGINIFDSGSDQSQYMGLPMYTADGMEIDRDVDDTYS